MSSAPTDVVRAPRVGLVIGVLVALALGLLAAVPAAPTTYWLVALWVAWLATLAWSLVGRRPSLAVAGLQCFLLLEVVAPATIAVTEGRTMIGPYDVTAGTVGALQLSTLAQVAILVGAVAARAWLPATDRTPVRVPVAARRLDRWAVGLLAVALVCLVAYVVVARGDPARLIVLVGDAKYNDFLRSTDGPVVKYFASLVGLAGVAIVVVALRLVTGGWRRPWIPLGVVVLAASVLTSGGGRWFLVIPAVTAGLVWWRLSSAAWARHARLLLVGGTAALFVFAVLVGGLRDQAGVKDIDLSSFVDKQVRGGTFATSAVLVDTVPDHFEYLYGRSYVEVLAMPVPRALWPDKPEGAVKDLQRAFFSKEIGASFPFSGELYANFGWIGAALGCVLFGFLLEGSWLALTRARTTAGVVVWAAAVPTLLQMFSRGYLAGLIAGVAGFVVGIFLVALALQRADRAWRGRAGPDGPGRGRGARPGSSPDDPSDADANVRASVETPAGGPIGAGIGEPAPVAP